MIRPRSASDDGSVTETVRHGRRGGGGNRWGQNGQVQQHHERHHHESAEHESHRSESSEHDGQHGQANIDHQPVTVSLEAKVVTVSDGVVARTRQDRSGQALVATLVGAGWDVVEHRCVADGVQSVSETLKELASDFTGLVVTTGGTGFGPRDLTPEGTRLVLERLAPGMAEAMRLASPTGLGRLSRAEAGTRGRCLILNTPGSPKGAVETLNAVIDMIPHAVALMAGERPH